MSSVISAIQNTVPLSQFNRGLTGKIFADVKSHGSKVVMKNNTAEVVLVPLDEYIETMDALAPHNGRQTHGKLRSLKRNH